MRGSAQERGYNGLPWNRCRLLAPLCWKLRAVGWLRKGRRWSGGGGRRKRKMGVNADNALRDDDGSVMHFMPVRNGSGWCLAA